MSNRARDFLVHWFDEHIRPLPPVKRLAASVRLATQCRLDATAAHIPLQEIRDVVDGDLIRAILDALNFVAVSHDHVSLVPDQSISIVDGASGDAQTVNNGP
jgi:hypothetical protein